ncbi:MAG: hypothetical protein JNL01_06190 [Bdellovibrionales bacterium]|nr:hypothetical protein [Bdellovibrionales bacterium]
MMSRWILFLVLGTSISWAKGPKEDCCGQKDPVAKISVDPNKELKTLAAMGEAEGIHAVELITEPSHQGCSWIAFKFPEKKLLPGEALYFSISEDLRTKPVTFVVLGHRQDPGSEKGMNRETKWDDVPGLTSVQVHSSTGDAAKAWRYWAGQASGEKGAKFAEVSYSPEIENLYEWLSTGHSAVSDDSHTTHPVRIDAARAVSLGKDPVWISQLVIKTKSPVVKTWIEAIFSPGTEFPATSDKKPVYGGGQSFRGKFPGAFELPARKDVPIEQSKKGFKRHGEDLVLPLVAGRKLAAIEVAAGDSHPDEITNSDGGWGTKGWSKLSIGILSSDGQVRWLMERENVPPEGILMTGPKRCSDVIKEGDQLIIRGEDDTVYLMGVRVGFQ